jgi:chemotaxis protein CheD
MAKREFLHPGECRLFTAPTEVEMVLGSCVAVCLWREDLAASAVCHSVLPHRHHAAREAGLSGRYVDEAVEMMLSQLRRVPGHAPIAAGIAGGCWSLLAGEVARRNSRAARQMLAQCNMPLRFDETGGNGYRKFWFDTSKGIYRCTLEMAFVPLR